MQGFLASEKRLTFNNKTTFFGMHLVAECYRWHREERGWLACGLPLGTPVSIIAKHWPIWLGLMNIEYNHIWRATDFSSHVLKAGLPGQLTKCNSSAMFPPPSPAQVCSQRQADLLIIWWANRHGWCVTHGLVGHKLYRPELRECNTKEEEKLT